MDCTGGQDGGQPITKYLVQWSDGRWTTALPKPLDITGTIGDDSTDAPDDGYFRHRSRKRSG